MTHEPPLRLLVDAHVLDQEYQGSATFIGGIYQQLARKEDIELFIASKDPDRTKAIFPFPGIHFLRYDKGSRWPRLLISLPALMARHRIDWAHFQYVAPPVKNARFILTIHDLLFYDYPEYFPLPYRVSRKMMFRWAASGADMITTVSEYSRSSIEKHFGIPAQQVLLVPNGISELYFQSGGKELSKQRIREKYGMDKFLLYVSRFEPRKNHIALLRSFIELELYKQGFHLALLGHRSLPVKEFDQFFHSLSPEQRGYIFISDDVHTEELLDFYRACSVFVYPSLAEGFGIPPLEAAALGVPVICSNATSLRDFHFFGDRHIDMKNPDLLKEKMAAVLHAPPSMASLEVIKEIIRKKYSWESSAERFYQGLMQKSGRKRPGIGIQEKITG